MGFVRLHEHLFVFTTPHTVGERIKENYELLVFGKGYDHTSVLDNKEAVDTTVYDPSTGQLMKFITV